MRGFNRVRAAVRAACVAVVLGILPMMAHDAAAARSSAPSVTALALHVESAGLKFAPTNASLSRVGATQPIRVVLYTSFAGVVRPFTVGVGFTVSHGGKTLIVSRTNFVVSPASLGGSSQGWRWFWNTLRRCGTGGATPGVVRVGPPECLPGQSGRYTVQAVLTFGASHLGQSTTFTQN
jgi:hypothetical protein